MHRVIVCSVINEKQEILLVRRTKDRKHAAGKWHVIAGHIENEEKPEDTLKRELKEEASITEYTIIKKGKPFIENSSGADYEVHVFLISTKQPLHIDQKEHDQWAWVPINKIKDYDIMPYLAINLAAVDIKI